MGRALLVGVVLASACSTNEVQLSDNLTVFDDALAATMVVEPEQILVPAEGNEWVATLPAGRILASGWNAGFLRRLDAASREGDTIVLVTTQAGIPDAVKRGRVHEKIDLSRTPMMQTDGASQQALIEGDLETGITLSDIQLYEKSKVKVILKHAFIRLTPSSTFDLQIDNGTVVSADIGISGDAELQATLAVESDGKLAQSFTKSLWTGKSIWKVYWIGWFPIVVEYKLSLSLFAEVALECGISIEASASMSGQVEANVHYDGNEATADSSGSLTGSATWPMLTRPAPISAKVSLRPRVDAKFYGFIGPFLTTGVYLRGVLAPPLQSTLYGGVEASLGGQIKILDPLDKKKALIDKSIKTGFTTQEWPLLVDTLSGMPIDCAPPDGGTDLAGADLAGAGADLSSVDLSSSDLAGVDLSSVDLSSSDLAGADLARADLAVGDMGGRCNGAMTPPDPDSAHLTFDSESASGPMPGCGKAFDATGQCAIYNANVAGDMFSGPFTLAVWIKDQTTDPVAEIMGNSILGAMDLLNGFGLFSLNNGPIWFDSRDKVTDRRMHIEAGWSRGVWHHVAVTSDAKVYVDGALAGSGTIAPPFSSGQNLIIGENLGYGCGPGTGNFEGLIDDLRIYRRVLTGAELRDVSCSCGPPPDMAAPDDLAVPPDMAQPDDLASDDGLVSCTSDMGTLIPPGVCTTGTWSGSVYVVCRADCESAWISADATGGTYDALAVCSSFGYSRLGSFGTTGGAECGAFESGTSCSNIGQRSFNSMGALGGGLYGSNVQWECLP